jgi:hypothetical protein
VLCYRNCGEETWPKAGNWFLSSVKQLGVKRGEVNNEEIELKDKGKKSNGKFSRKIWSEISEYFEELVKRNRRTF